LVLRWPCLHPWPYACLPYAETVQTSGGVNAGRRRAPNH
jgi:hypothetical protein